MNTNILLVAPSGLGKTTLAYKIITRLRAWNDTQVSGPPEFYFDSSRRFHIFDEVHELDTPEALYPMLDSGEFTFILATNETGLLKDPLINRGIYTWIFQSYSSDELAAMAVYLFSKRGFNNLPDEFIQFCVDRSGGVPRQLRNIVYRLSVIFSTILPRNLDELRDIVTNILNISEGGLDAQDRMYVEFLRDQKDRRAGLDMIANSTGITKETITRIIEPNLARRGLIRITTRGRELL